MKDCHLWFLAKEDTKNVSRKDGKEKKTQKEKCLTAKKRGHQEKVSRKDSKEKKTQKEKYYNRKERRTARERKDILNFRRYLPT
ncbi:MAG: hypothetical protein ACXWV3_08425 [Flavisolibacter sp.]